jgi:two-component system sensor histidine kinase YesM
MAQQQFYLEGLEKEIESIKILQYDCLNDENLNKLAIQWEVMDNYSRSESMRLLQQRLVTIKNSSNYIKDVIVYILPIQKSISAVTGLNLLDMQKFQSMKVPAGSLGAQIIYYQDGIYLSTMQENMPFTSLFLIEVELNKEAMRQALVQFNTYSGSGSFLIDRNNSAIVSDSSNLSLVGDIVRGLRQSNANSIESITIGGKDYYIVYDRSDYLNIALIRYISAEVILQPLKNFYLWVWLYSCVAIGIIIAYALSAYKYMHKPLRELVKSFHRVETGDFQVSINHNSNDEFGYLYNRFNEMIRNLNLLIKQVYEHKILAQRLPSCWGNTSAS